MPRPDRPTMPALTRRDLMLAAGAGAVSLVLPGCGGGGGGGSSEPSPATVAGIVEPGSLAASGGLSVSNVYGLDAPVGAGGEFAVTASRARVMPHFVADGSGRLMGMAVSQPGQAITVNAESTLLGVLLLVPGIMVQESSAAEDVVVALRSQPSYQSALSYFRTSLPVRSLEALMQEETTKGLIQTCVEDYVLPSLSRSRAAAGRGVEIGKAVDGFSVKDSGKPRSSTTITMTNDSWRVIRVDRIEYDAEDVEIRRSVPRASAGRGGYYFQLMDGKQPLSLAKLFRDGRFAAPTVAKDDATLNLSRVARTEYWIQGMGKLPVDPDLRPSGLGDYSHQTYCATLLHYVIWPFISASLAAVSFARDVLLKIYDLVSDCLDDPEFAPHLEAIVQSVTSGQSRAEILAAIVFHVKAILSLIVEKGLLILSALVVASLQSIYKQILKFADLVFIEAHMVAVTAAQEFHYPLACLTIRSSGDGGVIVT